ncbi:MAG: hypothetical protein RLZZ09_1998 [Pseudomonadota bacterium]|jgi:hypothetical protein
MLYPTVGLRRASVTQRGDRISTQKIDGNEKARQLQIPEGNILETLADYQKLPVNPLDDSHSHKEGY